LFESLRSRFERLAEAISSSELKGRDLDRILDDFRLSLLENDVALPVAEELCEELRGKLAGGVKVPRFGERERAIKPILRELLLKALNVEGGADLLELARGKRSRGEPLILVFMGINGTGKTTTIAKVARYLAKNGFSAVLACSDTYRTGSIEQLEEHGRRLGIPTIKHKYGADAAAVAFDAINHARAKGINAVLIDTAGRMQTNKNLLEEMKKIVRVSNPDLAILVVDALAGNDAVEQGRVFSEAVRVDGIILTKLDADAKGGNAISLARAVGRPILFFGIGQGYDDLIPFDPEFVIRNIIG
jgi:fused signal recognition particle receptor